VVPHVAARETHRRSLEFSFFTRKRLFQHYPHLTDVDSLRMVLSEQGKEAVVGILEPGQFFGESCLNGHSLRIATTMAIEECVHTSITKEARSPPSVPS
jgi:hypothetical protein